MKKNNAENRKIIGERIKMLLEVNQMKQKDLAELLGVTVNTVSYYVTGYRCPSVDQIIIMSKKFGISSDFLLGLVDISSGKTTIREFSSITGLSEEAIEALESLNEIGYYDDTLNVISILVENETAPPFENYYEFEGDFLEDEYENDLYYWKKKNYIPVISKIVDYLAVDSSNRNILKVFKDGTVKETSKNNKRIFLGSIASLDLSSVIENAMLDEIKRYLIRLKKKIESQRQVKGGEQNANDHTEERDI